MRQLVLVHGRSPHRKDAAALRAEWLDALHSGLAAAGLALPIPESEVRFPYYGDARLALLVRHARSDDHHGSGCEYRKVSRTGDTGRYRTDVVCVAAYHRAD